MRCQTHRAFDADNCPSCGTARPVGMTTPEVIAFAEADLVDQTADKIREEFGENDEIRASFASDPGGWLDYSGAYRDVSDEIAAAAISRVVTEWGYTR